MLLKIILLFMLTSSGFEARKLPPYDFPKGSRNQSRIIGGQPAEIGEFPYQVCLRSVETGEPMCGGTIITSRHILTAAHCFLPGTSSDDYFVYVGSNLLSSGGVDYSIEYVNIHDDYVINYTMITNDIAIIALKTDIMFNSVIRPATLPTFQTANGVPVQVSGWGRFENDSPMIHDELMKLLYYPIFDLTECMQIYNSPIDYGKICALGLNGQGVCFGDSGGPLSLDGTVIGVASYVFREGLCAAGYPDVFTNVYFYLRWIIDNTESYSDQLLLV